MRNRFLAMGALFVIQTMMFARIWLRKESWVERIWDGITEALASSAAIGGGLGAAAAYLVGGFGIAAMGTAVGVGSAVALPVLTVTGAVFGAVIGGGNHIILQFLSDPGDFRIVWPNLAFTILVSAITAWLVTEVLRRIALHFLPDVGA